LGIRPKGVVPVAHDDRVAAGAELAGPAPLDRLAGGGVNDLDLDVRLRALHGGGADRSRSSSVRVWAATGDVSAMPKAMETSAMFMSLTQRFVTPTGHTAPAMMPMRRDERSNDPNSG
jgi:hypothetical protein